MELYIETLTGAAFELRVSPFETVMSVKAKIQRLEGNRNLMSLFIIFLISMTVYWLHITWIISLIVAFHTRAMQIRILIGTKCVLYSTSHFRWATCSIDLYCHTCDRTQEVEIQSEMQVKKTQNNSQNVIHRWSQGVKRKWKQKCAKTKHMDFWLCHKGFDLSINVLVYIKLSSLNLP